MGLGNECLKEMTVNPRVAKPRAVKSIFNKQIFKTAWQKFSPVEADQMQNLTQPPWFSPLLPLLHPHLFWNLLHLLFWHLCPALWTPVDLCFIPPLRPKAQGSAAPSHRRETKDPGDTHALGCGGALRGFSAHGPIGEKNLC